ncbi:MAG: DUF368 domain-containing protein [Ruminococcus sp.]
MKAFLSYVKTFAKGIVVGLGGIAPGLSGSVLLVIFGLYQKTINAISTFFKDFKNNIKFLIPLVLGCGIGVVAFSKFVDFVLLEFELYTRLAFLGLIVGTIPLFWKEVRKEGFKKRYYFVIAGALAVGIVIFWLNPNLFPQVKDPNIFQSVLLGVAVAGSAIIPGVDSAAILSSLGLYEIWVSSVANLDIKVLIPAAVGLIVGVLIFSFIINKLIKKFYTATFSVIFGLFLSIVPTVLKSESNIVSTMGLNPQTAVAIVLFVLGFALSIVFGNLESIKDKITAKKSNK